jgi:hypothetical protein
MNPLSYLVGLWKDFFPDKKEMYPYSYAKVLVNPIAKSKGIMDEHNKIIQIYENGELKEEIEYTPQILEAIRKVDELPVYEEEFNEEEDFEFYPFNDLGSAKT